MREVIIIPTLTDWCAKLYEHGKFTGWEFIATETNENGVNGVKSFIASSKNNAVSSIKVRNGCQLTAYQETNGENPLFTINKDLSFDLSTNDKLSSYSCTCDTGKYFSHSNTTNPTCNKLD